jgi:hypothetical protein
MHDVFFFNNCFWGMFMGSKWHPNWEKSMSMEGDLDEIRHAITFEAEKGQISA